MELESIVANTVYIKAKEAGTTKEKRRSKKWKDMLKLPHYTLCLDIEKQIEKTYDYIVNSQPIGKELFWKFCRQDEYFNFIEFLEQVAKYEISLDDERRELAQEINNDYLNREKADIGSKQQLVCAKVKANIMLEIELKMQEDTPVLTKNLFDRPKNIVIEFLRDEPFNAFLNSVYFRRYLQWKWLEMRPVTKDTFRMYRVLGKGGFGEVCACQSRASGKLYACKKMEKKRIKKRNGEFMALNEKNILQKVNSRFIVNLAYTFETKDCLCLVLTIMNGGDLCFHIHNFNNGVGFEEMRCVFYAVEIFLGLQHLHSLNIVYRDLKPENILIDDEGHLRISDLGLAIHIYENQPIKGKVGTLGYMAPEVIKNEKYMYSPDWFGYGCIIYEMINGDGPFRKRKDKTKREVIEKRMKDEPESYNEKFSPRAISLCRKLLLKEPKQRLGCGSAGPSEIQNHPWFHKVNWNRMQVGIEEVPFIPDPQAVYAKDVLEIEQFSSVKGVTLEEDDALFHKHFCTGAMSIPWQQEMIEMECYKDLNLFKKENTDVIVDDLNSQVLPKQESASCCSCFKTKSQDPKYSVVAPVETRKTNDT